MVATGDGRRARTEAGAGRGNRRRNPSWAYVALVATACVTLHERVCLADAFRLERRGAIPRAAICASRSAARPEGGQRLGLHRRGVCETWRGLGHGDSLEPAPNASLQW